MELVENERVFTNRVLNNLATMVDDFLNKSIGHSFEAQVRRTIMQKIRDAPEYKSLISSASHDLQAQLGIVDPVGECEELFRIWSNEIRVGWQHTCVKGQNLRGSIYVSAIYADFQKVLSSPASQYISVNQQGESTPIPWLEWLLTLGKRIIIRTHYYRAVNSSKSRTGLGLMFHRGDKSVAGQANTQKMWRVPLKYSGTINNNWITRALDEARLDIMRHFARAILIIQRS